MDEENNGVETYFAVQVECVIPDTWAMLRNTAPTIELARDVLLATYRHHFPDKRLRIIKITEEPIFIDSPEV